MSECGYPASLGTMCLCCALCMSCGAYFNLIEQNHRVWLTSHCLCQLSSAFVPHITGWCSYESCSAVLFRILAHVQSDDHLLTVEQLSS